MPSRHHWDGSRAERHLSTEDLHDARQQAVDGDTHVDRVGGQRMASMRIIEAAHA